MSTSSSASKPSTGWQPPSLEEMQAMLPQYQFVSLLGRGGMGAVFKAVQISLDRTVAIKVLPVDLVADEDTQFAERFKNEARTMAKMNHPAIVNVYDFGETNTGLLYFVMEFINGTDVAQMIASQGKLPEDYALSITAHVSDALNYAHTRGVIHRDIKPANILINMDGAVKVADFGLAKQSDPGQSGITKTNMAMGTPDFVAPEALIAGIPLDGRADLYAMGVMLYQMLTGEIPRGIWSMPSKKLGTDPRFDEIIAKAMQTDREHRYQSAADLRRDLDTILTTPRAILIQQQQAAAEAKARETQAQKQKQAVSGPQKHPTAPPSEVHQPPVQKGARLGPIIGVAATLIVLAGLYFLLAGKEPQRVPKSSDTSSKKAPQAVIKDAQPDPIGLPAPKPAQPSNPVVVPKMAAKPVAVPSPTPISAPSQAEPGWTDLFATVDVARDTVLGTWDMTKGGLHCVPEGGHQDYFKFGPPSSEEYDYEIEFTVLRGRIGSVSQMLVVPGHRFALVMNAKPFVTSLGAHLDGKGWDYPERTDGIVREVGIEVGRRMRSKVEVRRGTVRVLIDDKEVINWSGDFKRLDLHTKSYDQRHTTQLAVACQNAEVVFHQARMRPIPEPGKMLTKVPAPPPTPTPSTGSSQWKMRKQGRSGWFAVASSADGNKLLAAAPGSVHMSADSGATWKSVGLAGQWRAAASSADGSRLAVAGVNTSIFTSTDAGATWTECPSGVHEWSSLACSADGMQIVAVRMQYDPGGIPIHISKDGGATWTPKSAGGEWWSSVASSADGTHLLAVSNGYNVGGHIHVSHDSGDTWIKRMTDRQRRWSSVASSADGTRLVAVDEGFVDGEAGRIYTSADSGETWVPTGPVQPWGAVASSASGHRLLATVGRTRDDDRRAGEIHVSTNFGESWEAQEAPQVWNSAASSADGTHLVAAGLSENGEHQIFTLDLRSFVVRAGNDPRLLKLEEGFRARYESDAQKPYLAAVAALNKSYINNGIAKARAAAQSRGSLKEVVAFDEVKARIEQGEGVPDVDEPDAPESLKSLRSIYRGALAKITAERDAKAAPLYGIYIRALDAYAAELMQAEKLEEAKRVQTLREDIASSIPRIASSPAAKTKPAMAASAAPAVAPKPTSGGSSWRTAAEFLVRNGGSFVASKNGINVTVSKEEEIPSGRFDILEINLDRANSLLPPLKDADFQALKGLRDLQRVSILPMHPGLTAAAYDFLAENDGLLSLRIEGDSDFSPDKLALVASAKKLEFIRIVRAPKFTGEGLDKLAATGSLTNLELLECGITDEGMRAIAACKKLQALFFNSTAVTSAGFAAITSLKTLTTLSAYGSSFDNEAADSVSRLTNLTSLDLTNTRIGDEGLQKLSSLKKLTSLNLGGSQVTLEAAETFQKANPQCRVSR
ncbi:MAG: protein kinase [Prosthecobacter sp.]